MEKQRAIKLTIRLFTNEHERIRAAAFAARLPVAEFVRAASLGREIQAAAPAAPPVNREAYADLARLAGAFNQVARQMNENKSRVGSELAGHVLSQLLAVSEQLAELRATLIGDH